MAFPFGLTFAGTPLLLDTAQVIRMGAAPPPTGQDESQLPPRKHQPLVDLVQEVNRRIDLKQYLQDFALPGFPGRSTDALARLSAVGPQPNPSLRLYDWYYPTGASRWSVFRGLMTSSMVRTILDLTGGTTTGLLSMQCAPSSPDNLAPSLYKVESEMWMLPPRPLGEGSSNLEGLFLVTFVDDRYYFQNTPASLSITRGTTWNDLISQLATALSVTINQPTIPAAYTYPEPDSQLWARNESAATLLDAVALNIGRVVVRNLDGTYSLLNPDDSFTIVNQNRGPANRVVRMAGGDLFADEPNITDLSVAKNLVSPASVTVNFPKYVQDEAPHFVNPRGANPRPSSWYQDGFGDVFAVTVPIASGGLFVSGLIGTSTATIHDTAKSLLASETGSPTNTSGLTALAMQIAGDYYGQRVASAIDEVYPGTYAWTPEGLHDIIWTWSARIRQAATRVMKTQWNLTVPEMQHSTPGNPYIKGVGGPLVAQTVNDSWSGSVSTALADALSSGVGGATAALGGIGNLPTDQRWKASLGGTETVLFEGTSGTVNVNIVYRGIDGTDVQDWASGTTVTRLSPDSNFGVNRWTFGKGQPVFPAQWTSGGSQGVNVVEPLQTVQVLSASGVLINAITHWSGQVQVYDSTQQSGAQFVNRELCWVTERNAQMLLSGQRYGGQFSDYSASGFVAPVYTANVGGGSGGGGGVYDTAVGYGFLYSITGASGASPGLGGLSFISGGEGMLIQQADRYGADWQVPSTTSGTYLRFVDEDNAANFYIAQFVSDNPFLGAIRRIVLTPTGNGDPLNLQTSGQKIGLGIGPAPTSTFQLTSGCVQSGHIGDAAVNSGNIASGAVGWPHLSSGTVRSGHVANAAINSGNIASGVVGVVHTQSGIVQGISGISVEHTLAGIVISAQSGIIVPAVSSGADIGVRVTCNLASGVGSGRFNIPAFIPPATISGYEIPFQSETYDTDQMWSGDNSGPIIRINTGGKYLCWADVNIYTDVPVPTTDFVEAQIVRYVSGEISDVIADANNLLQNNNSGYLTLGNRYATISLVGEQNFSSGDQIRVRVFNLSQSGICQLSAIAGARKTDTVTGGLLSGGAGSGSIASGAVNGFFGPTRNINSGTVGVFDFGSGAVVAGTVGSGAIRSGNVASGQLGTNHYGSGSVRSGSIASGQLGINHYSSGSIQGLQAGGFSIASGTFNGFELGSGAIVSGRIASGQVGENALASGVIGFAATQAEQETATALDRSVSPGRQQFHPSAAKAWVNFTGTGTPAANASYNLSSITDGGTGIFTMVWNVDFSSANYSVVFTISNNSDGVIYALVRNAPTSMVAGSCLFYVLDTVFGFVDPARAFIQAFGDQ